MVGFAKAQPTLRLTICQFCNVDAALPVHGAIGRDPMRREAIGNTIERLHRLVNFGWVPRLDNTTIADVVDFDHPKVHGSATLFSDGRVVVKRFDGHKNWDIEDDAAFSEMTTSIGKASRLERLRYEFGARSQIFLVFGVIPLAILLLVRLLDW